MEQYLNVARGFHIETCILEGDDVATAPVDFTKFSRADTLKRNVAVCPFSSPHAISPFQAFSVLLEVSSTRQAIKATLLTPLQIAD